MKNHSLLDQYINKIPFIISFLYITDFLITFYVYLMDSKVFFMNEANRVVSFMVKEGLWTQLFLLFVTTLYFYYFGVKNLLDTFKEHRKLTISIALFLTIIMIAHINYSHYGWLKIIIRRGLWL